MRHFSFWAGSRSAEPGARAAIAAGGHELASHGYSHQLVYTQTPDEFREDVRARRRRCSSRSGVPAPRLPGAELLDDRPIALGAGRARSRRATPTTPASSRFTTIAMACPARRATRTSSGRRQAMIVEAPATTVAVGPLTMPVAGGGYFRIFPYAFTRWAIRHVNEHERRPAIVYLHPWEVDPAQPRFARQPCEPVPALHEPPSHRAPPRTAGQGLRVRPARARCSKICSCCRFRGALHDRAGAARRGGARLRRRWRSLPPRTRPNGMRRLRRIAMRRPITNGDGAWCFATPSATPRTI